MVKIVLCSRISVLCSRSIASRADCSIALYPIASQPNSRITSAARRCVASSFSLNMSQNLERMPSGGPPSIMLRSSSGRPIDISCAREGGLDKATYIYIRFDLRRQRKHAKKKEIIPTSGYSECRISEQPDLEIPGWPEIWISGCPDIRLLGNPHIWLAGHPDSWISEYLCTQTSG